MKMRTDFKTELIAGFTTFLSTVYIVIVNPEILSRAGIPFAAVVTATVLTAALSSIFMGLYADIPIVLAPGMGLNAFFTYTVVKANGVPWETALGIVFWSGIIFIALSILNVRSKIVDAFPTPLRYAISGGIGLFIALIGFKNGNFVVGNPDTLLAQGHLTPVAITFLAGLLLTSVLVIMKVRGALLIGIILTTVFAFPIGRWWGDASTLNNGIATLVTWKGFFSAPDFSAVFKCNILDALKWIHIPIMFSFVFSDMFDSLSTLIGVCVSANILDEKGNPKNLKKALIVDGFASAAAGVLGSSSGTSYVESAAGVEAGGRTGLTAIIAGLLFLPLLFLSPIVSIVPGIATAPVLVLVGVFMMSPLLKINWVNMEEAIPCFLGSMLIPFTFSITSGIVWAILAWTFLKLFTGQWRKISITLWVLDAFAILSLAVSH